MSKYVERLKKFSKNTKLVFASDAWIKAINYMDTLEKENQGLKELAEDLLKDMEGNVHPQRIESYRSVLKIITKGGKG